MSDVSMRILLSATDAASGVIRNLASSITGGGGGVGLGLVGALASAGVAAASLAVATGVSAVKMAGDFQDATMTLVTGAGESLSNLDMIRQGILKISVVTGTSTDELTKAMFTIESAGYRAGTAIQVETAAAEGARVAHADFAQMADVLTTSLHDYHLAATSAIPVTNSLIVAVQNGKMVMDDLNQSMTKVLPVAAALHVPLADVEGALSAMAISGDKGAAAGTHLAMMLKMLANPASTAAKEMKAMGINSITLAQTMETSLPKALQMIQDAVAKHFVPSSVEYKRAISTILGGSKSGIAGLEIMGDNMKTLVSDTNAASAALHSGGNAVMGWSTIQQNFNVKMDQFQSLIGLLMIKLGEQLLPVLTQLLAAVMPIVQAFADWITQSGALQDALSFLTGGIGDMATMISGSFSQMQQNAAYSMLKIKDDSISKSLETANGVLSNMQYQKHFLEMELSQTTDTNQRAYLKMQLDATDASLKQAQHVVNNYTTQRKGIETQMSMATDSVALQTLKQKDIALTASLDQANGVVANYDQQRKDILQELQRTTDPVRRAYLETELDAIDKSHRQAATVAANYKKQHDDVVKQMDDMKTKVNADNNNILTNMLSTFKKIGDAFAPVVGPFQQLIGLIKQFTQDMLQGVFASDGFHEAMGLLLAALPPLLYVLGQVVLWLGKVIKFVFDNQTAFFLLGVAALGLAAIITVVLVAAFAALVVELALTVLWLTILFGPIIALVALIMNWGAVMAWLGGVWNNVITGMENAWNGMVAWAYTAGQMLVNSLISGIVSRIPGIGGIMQQITAIIDSYLPHSPAKQGPLSRLNEYGPALVRGITAGVDRSLPLLQASMQLMVTPIHRAALGQTGGTPGGLSGQVGIAPSGSSGSGGTVTVIIQQLSVNDFGPNMPDSVSRQLAQKISQQLAHNMRTQSGRIIIGNG